MDVIDEVGQEHQHQGHQRNCVKSRKVLFPPRPSTIERIQMKFHACKDDAQQRDRKKAGGRENRKDAALVDMSI